MFKQKENENSKIIYVITTIMIIGLSFMIMGITLAFASSRLNRPLFASYFESPLLLFMNFIPIFLLMCFLYIIFNKLWIAYSITSLVFVVSSLVNKFKLTYRDDPFSFIDMNLFSESLMMAGEYDISLNGKTIILLIFLVGIGIGLKLFYKHRIESRNMRLSILGTLSVISIIIFSTYYFDSNVYAELGDEDKINRWIESEQFQSKGFVYPFIYSIKTSRVQKPEAYDEVQAKKNLEQYEYKNIPEDKKVNVISIMLEAYNDFSEFEGLNIDEEVYENFHRIEEDSISGKLVTNVFAGGTINTERGFLTGYNSHPKYFKDTNSFVRYFKEQGYRTEAMHPITGSFYNRRNVNEYLGFDEFYHYDNKYGEIQEEVLDDMEFFDYIIEGFENSMKEETPYFHFSVTYQNHGPYSEERYNDNKNLEKKSHYNDKDYNIINNYLSGIKETDQALKKLFDYFEEREEPTIIVLFGDHNPWLGTDNSVYKMLNIDMDLGTVEGFRNYYQTPYIIWGNDGAKESLDKDFLGQGNTISPNQLMTEIFDYAELEGNEYMQVKSHLKKTIDVNHDQYFKENGEFTKELSEENEKLWKEFRDIEYYYGSEKIK